LHSFNQAKTAEAAQAWYTHLEKEESSRKRRSSTSRGIAIAPNKKKTEICEKIEITQQQMERAAHEKRRDKETGRLKKKQRLRTSQDVYNRIMWDTARYDPASFVIGYLDRFDGMMEIALDEFVPIDKGGDIAYHRVYYFRQGDVVVWDRNNRIDNVFGSGDTAAAAAAAAATTTTTTTTSSDDSASSSASEEDEGEEADQPTTAAPATTEQPAPASKQPSPNESMPKMRSCGFLLFADVAGSRHFLLMKHGRRYDLPKGHVESGETDRECALREVWEETGIKADAIHVDSRFSYAETYYPVYKRLGGKTVEKTLCVFIGHINDTAARDPTGTTAALLATISVTFLIACRVVSCRVCCRQVSRWCVARSTERTSGSSGIRPTTSRRTRSTRCLRPPTSTSSSLRKRSARKPHASSNRETTTTTATTTATTMMKSTSTQS
jgi:hypothetical protein